MDKTGQEQSIASLDTNFQRSIRGIFEKYKPVIALSIIPVLAIFVVLTIVKYEMFNAHIDIVVAIFMFPVLAYISVVLLDYLQGTTPLINNLQNKQYQFPTDRCASLLQLNENTRDDEIDKTTCDRHLIMSIIENNFNYIISRLKDEINKLVHRGNLNLVLGIVSTIAGIMALTLIILRYSYNTADPMIIISYYIPRVTLVLLIEVFSYFFLTLYKSSLVDIKYFQNEITNLEAWFTSLQISITCNNNADISNMLSTLSRVERNLNTISTNDSSHSPKSKINADTVKQITGVLQALIKTDKSNK